MATRWIQNDNRYKCYVGLSVATDNKMTILYMSDAWSGGVTIETAAVDVDG